MRYASIVRRCPRVRPSGLPPLVVWALGAVLLGAVGCGHLQTRGQSGEDAGRDGEYDLSGVQTVYDVADVGNALPLQVSGVGLVTGLEGTGGGAPQSEYSRMLEQQLLKQGVRNVRELLNSPDNAVVLLSAIIPPGARKGDALDIEVSLPEGSKATSLSGGYLEKTVLRNFDTTRNLNPGYPGADRLLTGHILARAHGPLLVGFGAGEDDAGRLLRGRIWDGGESLIDRPFYLVLKNDAKFARVADAVARRINLLFPDDEHKRQRVLRNKNLLVLDEVTSGLNEKFKAPMQGKGEVAKAATKELVYLQLPHSYRLNPERYLRVALKMPLRETAEGQGKYRQQLRQMLLDPAHTIAAAIRLEALGKESVPALKEGLRSGHPLVRFACAEALTYLGTTAGVDELARLCEQQEALRAYCFTALANLDDVSCSLKLKEMLSSPSAEVRYGAFRALRLLEDPVVTEEGELLGNSFLVYRVAAGTQPLVHFSTARRAELVFFGDDPVLRPPFRLMLKDSEFTVTAAPGDDRCTVSRFVLNPPSDEQRQCSLRLGDVLRTMARLGAQYTDATELLRQVQEHRCVNTDVAKDALPLAIPVEDLAMEGRQPRHLKLSQDSPGLSAYGN
jgi:hypothetical protein